MTALTEHRLNALTKQIAKQICFGLLIIFILLLTLRSAFALSITGVAAPTVINEGALLNISFTSDEPAAMAILRDGEIISTTDAYSELLGHDAAGLFTFTFRATSGAVTVNVTKIIEIVDAPVSITIAQPSATDYATHEVPAQIETNVPVDLCYVIKESGTSSLSQINSTIYSGLLQLADGIHLLTFKCNRNGEVAAMNVTLRVDATPPGVSLAPTGTLTETPVVLSATSDEIASCRYGTADAPYDLLPLSFSEGAALSHTATLDISDGTYTYYVACRDVLGNTGATLHTSFTLQKAPTATLAVEGSNPHKAGTYKVTLDVSEELAVPPTLTLVYQGGGSSILALSQKGSLTYEGVVIVADDAGEQVGSFQFKGRDKQGADGAQITDGELFMVDTIKPPRVETFSAVNGSGHVNLTWYFETDHVTFNIYRSKTIGVQYTDFLTDSEGSGYRDYDVQESVIYYYRIAAVDSAGNVGELSREEWASPAAATYSEQKVGELLDPVLQVGLNVRIHDLERDLLDADQAIRTLQQETDEGKAKVISMLGLLDAAENSRRTLLSTKERLEALRYMSMTQDEFTSRVTAIRGEIDDAKAHLPISVSVQDGVEYVETADASDVDNAMARVLKAQTLTIKERDAYRESVERLLGAATITVNAQFARVTYADDLTQPYTIIEKRIALGEMQQGIILIETIPKSMAQRASDILFLEQQPVVLEEDPVVQYAYDQLSEATISYVLKGTMSAPSIRDSVAVLLPRRDDVGVSAQPSETSGNALTGNAMAPLSFLGNQGLLIMIGIILVGALLVYYLKVSNETPQHSIIMPSEQQNMVAATQMLSVAAPVAQTIIVERNNDSLAELLLKGHTLIDENKYLDALHFYKQVLAFYEQERFSSGQLKEAVRQEIVLLNAKLRLFDVIAKGHDAVHCQDNAALAVQMEEMRALAAVIGDVPTPLLEKAKTQYYYFHSTFRRLSESGEEREELL